MFLCVVLWVVAYRKEFVINLLGALYWCISPSLTLPSASLRVCDVAEGRGKDIY